MKKQNKKDIETLEDRLNKKTRFYDIVMPNVVKAFILVGFVGSGIVVFDFAKSLF